MICAWKSNTQKALALRSAITSAWEPDAFQHTESKSPLLVKRLYCSTAADHHLQRIIASAKEALELGATQRVTGYGHSAPSRSGKGSLPRVQGVAELEVAGWHDINRIDVRPGRGVAKVWLHSGWEVQVDHGTGRVLQTAYRRSDLIESIHDGSFFAGNWSKLGIFLPAGIALMLVGNTSLDVLDSFLRKSANAKNRHQCSTQAGRGGSETRPPDRISVGAAHGSISIGSVAAVLFATERIA